MSGIEVVNYAFIAIYLSETVSAEEIDLIVFLLFSAGSHYPVGLWFFEMFCALSLTLTVSSIF